MENYSVEFGKGKDKNYFLVIDEILNGAKLHAIEHAWVYMCPHPKVFWIDPFNTDYDVVVKEIMEKYHIDGYCVRTPHDGEFATEEYLSKTSINGEENNILDILTLAGDLARGLYQSATPKENYEIVCRVLGNMLGVNNI